jgi:hypothetical protein
MELIPDPARQWRPTPKRRRSITNVSLPTTPRRRILPLPPMVRHIRLADTPDTLTLQDIPEWEQLHPETINTTQATTPRWETESQLGPEGSPINAINILKHQHRLMEATITTAAATTTPETRTETPLSYEDAPQSQHSPTPIHNFLMAIQMCTETLQYNYTAYVGTTHQPMIPIPPVQPIV